MYLADTNIVSAFAPDRPPAEPLVERWLERISPSLFLSVITIMEAEAGICRLERMGASRKASRMREWLDSIMVLYGHRVLEIDAATAEWAGRLSDAARGLGHAPGVSDALIAASGRRHGFTVLTRNLRHFVPLGVAAVDPFAGLPEG